MYAAAPVCQMRPQCLVTQPGCVASVQCCIQLYYSHWGLFALHRWDPAYILKIDDVIVFWGGLRNTRTCPPQDGKRHAFFATRLTRGRDIHLFNEELRAQMKLVLTLLRESLLSKQDLSKLSNQIWFPPQAGESRARAFIVLGGYNQFNPFKIHTAKTPYTRNSLR